LDCRARDDNDRELRRDKGSFSDRSAVLASLKGDMPKPSGCSAGRLRSSRRRLDRTTRMSAPAWKTMPGCCEKCGGLFMAAPISVQSATTSVRACHCRRLKKKQSLSPISAGSYSYPCVPEGTPQKGSVHVEHISPTR